MLRYTFLFESIYWLHPILVQQLLFSSLVGEELGWRGFVQPWLQER